MTTRDPVRTSWPSSQGACAAAGRGKTWRTSNPAAGAARNYVEPAGFDFAPGARLSLVLAGRPARREEGRMELMTSGAFARASGLSRKALRLYEELGLLRPVQVDQASQYRVVAPAGYAARRGPRGQHTATGPGGGGTDRLLGADRDGDQRPAGARPVPHRLP